MKERVDALENTTDPQSWVIAESLDLEQCKSDWCARRKSTDTTDEWCEFEMYKKLVRHLKSMVDGLQKGLLNLTNAFRDQDSSIMLGVVFHDNDHCTITFNRVFLRESLPLGHALSFYASWTAPRENPLHVRFVRRPRESHLLFFLQVRDEVVKTYLEVPDSLNPSLRQHLTEAFVSYGPFDLACIGRLDAISVVEEAPTDIRDQVAADAIALEHKRRVQNLKRACISGKWWNQTHV